MQLFRKAISSRDFFFFVLFFMFVEISTCKYNRVILQCHILVFFSKKMTKVTLLLY